MKHGTYTGDKFDVHGQSLKGKTALLMDTAEGLKAQFDDVATGYGHGWHLFPSEGWEIDPEVDWSTGNENLPCPQHDRSPVPPP